MVVMKLLQLSRLGVVGGSAGEINIEGGLLGIHRVSRDVTGNTTMNALFDQEAKSQQANKCGH
jgi:hypothetical protein